MVQYGINIGFSLGIHVDFWLRYVDIHIPLIVITIGNIKEVEYPPETWHSARDITTGVKYDDG